MPFICSGDERRFVGGGILCGHTIKEELKPLALRGFAVADEYGARADQEDEDNKCARGAFSICAFISHWSGSEKFLD